MDVSLQVVDLTGKPTRVRVSLDLDSPLKMRSVRDIPGRFQAPQAAFPAGHLKAERPLKCDHFSPRAVLLRWRWRRRRRAGIAAGRSEPRRSRPRVWEAGRQRRAHRRMPVSPHGNRHIAGGGRSRLLGRRSVVPEKIWMRLGKASIDRSGPKVKREI